jgi:hypothetical protein
MGTSNGMTIGDPRYIGLVGAGQLDADDDVNESDREPVGAGDAEADRIRAGGEGDLSDVPRDSDGVPVGDDDADEDATA